MSETLSAAAGPGSCEGVGWVTLRCGGIFVAVGLLGVLAAWAYGDHAASGAGVAWMARRWAALATGGRSLLRV